jgi:purine-cytosine permease-like protein
MIRYPRGSQTRHRLNNCTTYEIPNLLTPRYVSFRRPTLRQSPISAHYLPAKLVSRAHQDASLVIIFCNMFSCGIPSYLATFGPLLGLVTQIEYCTFPRTALISSNYYRIRTMVFARYSFGLYFASWPALLNLITFIIFCVLNSIVAGQTLAQVNAESVSVTVGIIIVAVISLIVSLGGYRTLHFVERYTWIPVTIAFIVLCGYNG